MKELLKFSSFNFVGNNRKNTISSVAHAVGSVNDREMKTSENGIGSCNNDVNVMLRYTKGIILGFIMFIMSFNVNGQSCTSNVSSCLLSGKEYVCIGEEGMTKNISDYIGNELFTDAIAETLPQYVVIKGEIVVDVPYHFSNASHIIFDVNHVLPHPLVINSSLEITGTVIQGCVDSWDKILVKSGGHLTIGGTSKVYDAYTTAIQPMAGSSLTLVATTFEKCNRAIDVKDGSFVHWIAYNTFKGGTTMNLSPGGKPLLAIRGDNAGLISMESCYFNDYCEESAVIMNQTSSDIKKCVFSDCCKSIESVNGENGAFAKIYECSFNDGERDVKISTDALLTENVFQNTEILCIEIVNADDRTIDIIDDNVLEFQSSGILYYSTTNGTVNITNNDLTGMANANFSDPIIINLPFRKTGMTIHDNDMNFNGLQEIVGIAVYSSGSGTKITKNIININNSTLSAIWEHNAIYLHATSNTTIDNGNIFTGNGSGAALFNFNDENLTVGCTNTFDNFEIGNSYNGVFNGAKIRENTYARNDVAISISRQSGFVGQQVHQANSWLDAPNSNLIDISSTSQLDNDKNKFVVGSNDDEFWPDPVTDPKLRGLQPGIYPSPCGWTPPIDFPMFGGLFPGDGFEWSFDYYRFGFVVDNPSVLSTDTAALSFYLANETGPIGLLYDEEQAWLSLRTMDASTQTVYDALIIDRDSHIADLVVVSEDWGTNPTAINEALFNTLRAELDVIQQSLATINSSNDATWLVDAAVILSNVSTISTPNVPEQNYQEMLEVVLENYLNGSGEWSTSHLTRLAALANQCSTDGGRSVSIARALLNGTLTYDDSVICTSSAPLSINDLRNIGILSISPNPSLGNVLVAWEKGIEPDMIEVYNVVGNLVITESLTSDMSTTTLDMNRIGNGVYVVKLYKGNKILQLNKLVLSK